MLTSIATQNNQYKDSLPSETVSTIRNILKELGLSMREVKWRSFDNKYFAVSLEDIAFRPSVWGLRVNGKGCSKELALAGAYAELMERLQNNCVPGFLPRKYGLMSTEQRAPDEVSMKISQIASKSELASKSLFTMETVKKYGNSKVICAPFYEVIDSETHYLPVEVLYWCCMSNGMCAGNTQEEALVQGICEVFERYAARELFLNDTIFPTIPLSDLKELQSYKAIKIISRLGYHVEVKDCTLGGKYPVIAILFFNSERSQYYFHAGSYPLLDIALQRCLSETVQGIYEPIRRENRLGGRMRPVVWKEKKKKTSNPIEWRQDRLRSYYSFYRAAKSEYPPILMMPCESSHYSSAFLKEFVSNKDTLLFLLGLIRKNGLKLFLRDVSFLGFPTFRVYIPGISEIFPFLFNKNMFKTVFDIFPRIRQTLLSLNRSSEDDIRFCAESIERVVGHPRFPKREFSLRWNVNINPDADFAQFNSIDYLLAILYYRIGEFEKAFDYMERYIWRERASGAMNNVERIRYFLCTLAYIGFRTRGEGEKKIKKRLMELFGDLQVKRIIRNLKDPKKVIDYFSVPECGDCNNCPISSECRYREWERLVDLISAKMQENPIDQRKSFISLKFQKKSKKI